MKRLITCVVAFTLFISILAGCSGNESERISVPIEQPTEQQQPIPKEPEPVTISDSEPKDEFEKISIIATIFPIYDWFCQIIGEENLYRFDLTLLLDSGIDTHSFSPSVSDILKIQTSDVFFYVGGHSDEWVYDVMADADPFIITENLLDILGDLTLHTPEFCFDDDDDHSCTSHSHNHSHNDDCDDDDDDDLDFDTHDDEHVWLSLRNAQLFSIAIADTLSELDPENEQVYIDNLNAYIAKLSILDSEFLAAVYNANVTTLVFADRFPFLYMMNDYGLDFYAAFSGCAAEAEASFATIISLAEIVDKNGLNFVMVSETSDQSIARTVIDSTNSGNQRILILNAMKNVFPEDIQTGATYLSIMKNNLYVLKEALMN